MEKICVICGRGFHTPPSSKKITCGRECSCARKVATHRGKHPKWSKAARDRNRGLRVYSPDLQQMAVAAAQRSPLAGPFSTNRNAKWWTITSPTGDIYHVRNLNLFTRDYLHLLDGTPVQAASGIRQIRRSQHGKLPRAVSQWKGWRLRED